MEYKVTGMTCSACSANVEKAVRKLDGVKECSVNLLTGKMVVQGEVKEEAVIDAVTMAGYGIKAKGKQKEVAENRSSEVKTMLTRLIVSLVFLVPLIYISMGHVMWGAPLSNFFVNNPVAIALLQLVFTTIVMVINQKIYIKGVKGIIKRAPNMDSLVTLGSVSGYVYSLVRLFEMTVQDVATATSTLHNVYFEATAMILVLITFGKILEAISKGRTTSAIESLIKLSPDTAVVIRDGDEVVIRLDEVRVGDSFIVKAGDKIAVDGVVIKGNGSVDQSALTGESIPVDKQESSEVYQGTILRSGYIVCKAIKVGEDTTLSKIIKTVTDASSTKAPIARLADKVAGVFVPVVASIALVTLAVWLIVGESFGYSLARAISVLVISCPCALGLATPVAIMVGTGKGARHGVLFKSAESIENLGKVKIVALDKTGTLTLGEPHVCEVISDDVDELLRFAYSLEIKSEHPLSQAIVKYANALKVSPLETTEYEACIGRGLQCKISNKLIRGGNYEYVSEICSIADSVKESARKLSEEGKTPLYFSSEDRFLGIIAVTDKLKEDAKSSIDSLKALGVKVVMLTGDNQRTANSIAKQVGIDEVYASLLPDDKARIVKDLAKLGKVAMVGDGINDAPALTSADIGIAIGAGSDIAIDSANVVIMSNDLNSVVKAVKLSRITLGIIKGNLFWAFCYNTLGIPLASGAFVPLFGWSLNPMFGALAMSLSSVCVITNALRLNVYKLGEKKNKKVKKEKAMKKVMKIEGIMCMHCEARVTSALSAIDGVNSVTASHKKGTAIVQLDKEVASDILKNAVEKEGYKVVSID